MLLIRTAAFNELRTEFLVFFLESSRRSCGPTAPGRHDVQSSMIRPGTLAKFAAFRVSRIQRRESAIEAIRSGQDRRLL